jgi:hypothetical protein
VDAYRVVYATGAMGVAALEAAAEKLAKDPVVATRVCELQLASGKSGAAAANQGNPPAVKNAVTQLAASAVKVDEAEAIADRTYVLSSLKSIADRCMQAEAVVDRKGEPTGEYAFQAQAATRALQLLGIEGGLFVERRAVTLNPAVESEPVSESAKILGKLFGGGAAEAAEKPLPH